MSWREQEFSHESSGYYRSLDQADANSAPQEACAGYHIEDGRQICDWFKCRGKRVIFRYLGPEAMHVCLAIEGLPHLYRLRIPQSGHYILAARKLAEKVLTKTNHFGTDEKPAARCTDRRAKCISELRKATKNV